MSQESEVRMQAVPSSILTSNSFLTNAMLLTLTLSLVTFFDPSRSVHSPSQWLVFLYMGPDTMMPLASALAAIIGTLLMFWHRLVGWTRRAYRGVTLKIRELRG